MSETADTPTFGSFGDALPWIRSEVGNTPDDDALQAIYDRHEANSVFNPALATVVEVSRGRLANFSANPATFNVEGDYSQSTAANITALQKQLDRLDPTDDGQAPDVLPPLQVVRTKSRWGR
jgi:hypothetical protein